MIEQLRHSFIKSAMMSVTLVLVLLIGSVNLVNACSVNRDLNNMLTMLTENRGSMPDYFPRDKDNEKPKDPKERPPANFNEETPFSTRFFVLRYTNDGRLLNTDLDHIASVTETDTDAYLQFALAHGPGTGYRDIYKYRIVQSEDGSWLAVFLDCRDELHSIRDYGLASILALAASIGLVYILILALSRKAMAPVAQSVEKQKQFITDASHELKTPLTVITTSLKVLEMDVGPQKWIDKAQDQVEHLKKLVNQLVTLSRLDEEKPPLTLTQFSISEAVQETAESFRDFAAANNRILELAIARELTYYGDEYAIRQLVSILMDNAVKYSDENGRICLTLEKTKKGILLRAFNTCPEMDIAETDKLFDRFYRIDKSRSKQSGGFGIGLSIARGIVQAHGGSIRASCPDPRSIEFTVILKQPARKKAEK